MLYEHVFLKYSLKKRSFYLFKSLFSHFILNQTFVIKHKSGFFLNENKHSNLRYSGHNSSSVKTVPDITISTYCPLAALAGTYVCVPKTMNLNIIQSTRV